MTGDEKQLEWSPSYQPPRRPRASACVPPKSEHRHERRQEHRQDRRRRGRESHWERRCKWSLLVVAVAMAAWTGAELVATLLELAEAPVTILARAPVPEPDLVAGRAKAKTETKTVHPAAPELTSRELTLLRHLLEATVAGPGAGPSSPGPKARGRQSLAPAGLSAGSGSTAEHAMAGISRARPKVQAHPRTQAMTTRSKKYPLKIAFGPRVRLVGSDALIEARVVNTTEDLVRRTAIIELHVDGRKRLERRVRLRVSPRAQVHISERFSTTLPDGTYSAVIRLDHGFGP